MFDAIRIYQGMTLYSPWFPRGGDFVVVSAECVRLSGSEPSLKIELFHKNADEPGDGVNVDTGTPAKSLVLNSVGRQSVDWKRSGTLSGLKELVRYRFTMTGGEGEIPDSMLFRLLPPVWYDATTTTGEA
jgi:hypothetical protein